MDPQSSLFFSFLKYKAVYFRVPKTASTSILISLRQTDSVERCVEYDERCFKFTFVRNPFDRLASCYRHIVQRGICEIAPGCSGMHQGMSFDEFVDAIVDIDVDKMNIHFRPQYTFLPKKVDYIGKFESLNEDFAEITQKIGIKPVPELLKENSTQKTIYNIYTKEIIEKVLKIYEKDFSRFGYSTNLPID